MQVRVKNVCVRVVFGTSSSISRRVLAAFFFYEDDRLKFRAIITMEIFNTIRSAVFSLSLSLSRSARVA